MTKGCSKSTTLSFLFECINHRTIASMHVTFFMKTDLSIISAWTNFTFKCYKYGEDENLWSYNWQIQYSGNPFAKKYCKEIYY